MSTKVSPVVAPFVLLLGAALIAQDVPSSSGRPARGGQRGKPIVIKVGTVHPVSGPDIKNGVIVIQDRMLFAVGSESEVTIPEDAEVLTYPEGHAYPGLIDAVSTLYVETGPSQAQAPQREGGGRRGGFPFDQFQIPSGQPPAAEAGLDAGSDIRTALNPEDQLAPDVVAAGITTAYVTSTAAATWRGQGALVRPRVGRVLMFSASGRGGSRGGQLPGGQIPGGQFPGGQASGGQGRPAGNQGMGPGAAPAGAAVQMRIQASGHALDRQKALANVGDPFDQLEAYEKSVKDSDKALEDYHKKYDEYLAWHRARKGEGGAESRPGSSADSRQTPSGSGPTGNRGGRGNPGNAESRPASDTPGREGQGRGGDGTGRGGDGTGRGRGQRGGDGTGRGGRPFPNQGGQPSGPGTASQPAGPGPGGEAQARGEQAGEGNGPQRPAYPKPVQHDLAKDALLKVKNGDLTLRVEAQKDDELRAALRMQKEKQIKKLVLEGAAEAGPLAATIAEQGVPVVLTGLPDVGGADAEAEQKARERAGLAKTLVNAGVTVAIASGSARASRNLPLVAAAAVGTGLPEAVALRALTLSAAEVLGIARSVGSLEKNKLGDVLITSGPLFASDSRVLRVLSAGESVYEAK